jgi:succinate dehydrogenase/fumarate reductase flavoprotein subunit
MELTQEYLDKALSSLATKDDLASQTKELKAYADEQTGHLVGVINETIAEPMERHFAELKDYVKTKEDVQTLKREMQRIKEALHLS